MWFLAIPAVIVGVGAILGCDSSDKKGEKIAPDPDAKHLPEPQPAPRPPRDPKDIFAQCFGNSKDYEIVVEHPGRGLCGRFSRLAWFSMRTAREIPVCFSADPGCDTGPAQRFGLPFHFKDGANFSSFPPEARTAPRGSPVRTDSFKRDWDFSYVLDGGLYADCSMILQMWQGAKSVSSSGSSVHLSRNLAGFSLPLYSPRKDGALCEAEPDFSNEKILTFDAPLCASFPSVEFSPPVSVASSEVKAGSDCNNRLGTTLPLKVTLNWK